MVRVNLYEIMTVWGIEQLHKNLTVSGLDFLTHDAIIPISKVK